MELPHKRVVVVCSVRRRRIQRQEGRNKGGTGESKIYGRGAGHSESQSRPRRLSENASLRVGAVLTAKSGFRCDGTKG